MKKSLLIFVILLGLVVLSYNDCGLVNHGNNSLRTRGTEITNPMTRKLAASNILNAVCDTLNRCYTGVTLASCIQSVLGADGFDQQLGLPANSYDPYSTL